MKSLTSLTKLVVDNANMLPSMKLPPSLQELTIRDSNIAPELFAQGKPLNALHRPPPPHRRQPLPSACLFAVPRLETLIVCTSFSLRGGMVRPPTSLRKLYIGYEDGPEPSEVLRETLSGAEQLTRLSSLGILQAASVEDVLSRLPALSSLFIDCMMGSPFPSLSSLTRVTSLILHCPFEDDDTSPSPSQLPPSLRHLCLHGSGEFDFHRIAPALRPDMSLCLCDSRATNVPHPLPCVLCASCPSPDWFDW